MDDSVWNDIRYAHRQMVRQPLVTLVTIVILGIGIGVNTALFCFVDALLLTPVPGLGDADRLVELRTDLEHDPSLDFRSYAYLKQTQSSFEGIAAAFDGRLIVDVDGMRMLERVDFVNGDYFTTLRPVFALGNAPPNKGDDFIPPIPGVVLSYRMWKDEFDGAPSVIGKTILVGNTRMAITGVLGKTFFQEASIFAPLAARSLAFTSRGLFDEFSAARFVAARLRPGVSVVTARTEMQLLLARRPLNSLYHVPTVVTPLRAVASRDAASTQADMTLIGNITLCVLLIAVANASVLRLSRSFSRRREIAIRFAVGAARERVLRQLITEGVLQALLAGIAGLCMVIVSSRGLERFFFPELAIRVTAGWRTFFLTEAFAALTGVLFAIAPALQATRGSITDALKDGGGGTDRRAAQMQRKLVVAEVALGMALLCATGVLASAARRAMRYDDFPYLNSSSVIASRLEVTRSRVGPQRKREAIERLISAFGAVPGVRNVTYANRLPGQEDAVVNIEGAQGTPPQSAAETAHKRTDFYAGMVWVGPNLFSALGIPIVHGRDITAVDVARSAPVAVVDEQLAGAIWPDANPIGKSLRFRQGWRDTTVHVRTIVGVIPRLSPRTNDITPTIYVPWTPDSSDAVLIIATNRRNGELLLPSLKTALRGGSPGLPVTDMRSLAHFSNEWTGPMKRARLLAGIAAFIALILSCIGVYATISYGVSQRVREIGIRRAMGANDRDVVYTFFEEGMRLALLGFAIGIPVALIAMSIATPLTFGEQTLTTPSIAAVMAVLLIVCAVASWLPARRAARVEALTALKED